jgi:hypothetical protein
MNKNLLIFLGIFASLAASRFIPHPPNFTSLIALSFYVPVFLGIRYIPYLIISFVITDIVIGYHNTTHWTWGSVLLIGLCSKFFIKNLLSRLTGSFIGAAIFYLVTNFGVWTTGLYGDTYEGLIASYVLAIPFFAYSIISTLVFSLLIETGYKYLKFKFDLKNFTQLS